MPLYDATTQNSIIRQNLAYDSRVIIPCSLTGVTEPDTDGWYIKPGTFVKLTGDYTVAIAEEGDAVFGFVENGLSIASHAKGTPIVGLPIGVVPFQFVNAIIVANADMAITAGSPVKINGQNVELWSATSTAAVQIPYVQAATNVDTVTDCYFVDDADGTLMALKDTEPVTTLKLSQCTDQTLVLSGGVGYIADSGGSSADLSKPVYTKTGSQYTVTPAVEADSPTARIGIVLKGSVLPNKTVEVLV